MPLTRTFCLFDPCLVKSIFPSMADALTLLFNSTFLSFKSISILDPSFFIVPTYVLFPFELFVCNKETLSYLTDKVFIDELSVPLEETLIINFFLFTPFNFF
jgi:hypothetical protein